MLLCGVLAIVSPGAVGAPQVQTSNAHVTLFSVVGLELSDGTLARGYVKAEQSNDGIGVLNIRICEQLLAPCDDFHGSLDSQSLKVTMNGLAYLDANVSGLGNVSLFVFADGPSSPYILCDGTLTGGHPGGGIGAAVSGTVWHAVTAAGGIVGPWNTAWDYCAFFTIDSKIVWVNE